MNFTWFKGAKVAFSGLLLVGFCLLMNGCAAVAPLSGLIGSGHGATPGLEVHEQTSVNLGQDNFVLVKTNVVGHSRGFSLLGFVTIIPATLTKAMSRMYAGAQMPMEQPQTIAHLVIEHSSSYYILFGIPKVEVRADIVAFKPQVKTGEAKESKSKPPRPPPKETALIR